MESFEEIRKKRAFNSMKQSRPGKLRGSEMKAGTTTMAYIYKKKYGGQNDQSDEEEEKLRETVADKTPATQRRLINEKEVNEIPKLSPLKTYITLIKGFIGSGILYLPNSFLAGGYGFSTIAIIFSCVLSMYCVTLLLDVKKRMGVNTYMDIGVKALGEPGKHTVNVLLAFSQFGFVCGYIYFIV
jgi:solute carrier family 36 (proton-coupled amino acid transporter)